MADPQRAASEVVREFIERDGVIRNGLARGLINVRALARVIQVATHEQHTFEAIVSAIHRYPVKETAAKYQTVGKLIQRMSFKNKVVSVSIGNYAGLPLALANFSEKVDYGRGDTFRVATGIETVTVVIDSKNLNKLLAIIPKNNIRRVEENLAEIEITMSEEATMTKGVIATLTTQLAMNDINMREFFGAPMPHAIVLVEENDALKAYRALEDLSKQR